MIRRSTNIFISKEDALITNQRQSTVSMLDRFPPVNAESPILNRLRLEVVLLVKHVGLINNVAEEQKDGSMSSSSKQGARNAAIAGMLSSIESASDLQLPHTAKAERCMRAERSTVGMLLACV
jgi:hypothetical protein